MSNKNTNFYWGNTSVILDFSAEGISSDGAVILIGEDRTQRKAD